MATFKVPLGVCKEMDGVAKKFWWTSNPGKSRYLALKVICKPKNLRDLGFQIFSEINNALLSKLAWRMGKGDEASVDVYFTC